MYCARSSNPRRTPAPAWTEHSPARDIVQLRMAEELLHRPDVSTGLQQVRRKGVTKRVHGRVLLNLGAPDRVSELAL